MAIDKNLSLPEDWGITLEMLENPAPRVPFIEPEAMPEDIREDLEPIYQNSLDTFGTVPQFFKMLAHSPILVKAWMMADPHINTRIVDRNSDPEYFRLIQLVILKTALINQCNNCTGHNVDLARALGFEWDQVELLQDDAWKESDQFSDKEKAVIRWADEVTNLRARDNDFVFEEIRKYFTDRQIVELTFTCGMWCLSGRVAEALRLTVEPPGKRIGFKSSD